MPIERIKQAVAAVEAEQERGALAVLQKLREYPLGRDGTAWAKWQEDMKTALALVVGREVVERAARLVKR